MKIKLDEITVSPRIRQEIGDLTALTGSIKAIGLLNPITVNEKNELLSGFRRLQVCKNLGWGKIDVRVVETHSDEIKELDIEYQENLGRLNLQEQDVQEYKKRKHILLNPPKADNKLFQWIKRFLETIRSFFQHLIKKKKVDDDESASGGVSEGVDSSTEVIDKPVTHEPEEKHELE